MEKYQVNSTSIESVGYDSDSKVLELSFLVGQTHQFKEVPLEKFYQLMEAPSKTTFVLNNILSEHKLLR